MRRHNDQHVRDILGAIFREPKLRDKLVETQIRQAWPQWFGPAVARYTDSMSFHRGVLELRFSSAPLRSEYRMMADRLRDKVNEGLGEALVKKVLVR